MTSPHGSIAGSPLPFPSFPSRSLLLLLLLLLRLPHLLSPRLAPFWGCACLLVLGAVHLPTSFLDPLELRVALGGGRLPSAASSPPWFCSQPCTHLPGPASFSFLRASLPACLRGSSCLQGRALTRFLGAPSPPSHLTPLSPFLFSPGLLQSFHTLLSSCQISLLSSSSRLWTPPGLTCLSGPVSLSPWAREPLLKPVLKAPPKALLPRGACELVTRWGVVG